ncbi:MAG: glycosyltransferase family 2 protein [Patescibacteria group bacterium]|nr:glycosyltransferase family 2 protein [Patescibacteria group bacterium]
MKPYLSIIIPAYNEAKRLPLTLFDIDKHLKSADFSYEIIVVDNNSTDATSEIVERFSHLIKNLRLIKYRTPGKGGAVQKGILEAKGEIRLFMDADNSTAIDQFNKMIPYLKEGYDVIIGSRDIEGAKLIPPQPWHKRLGGNAGNLIIQALLLPGIWDTQCGFKAFTAEAAEKIFPLLKTNRWGFDVEVLSLAKKFGYKIKEVPVVWVNNPFSKVSAAAYLQVLWEVVKIKWWLTTGKYKNL